MCATEFGRNCNAGTGHKENGREKENAYTAPTRLFDIKEIKSERQPKPLILLVGLPGVEPGTNGL